MLLLKVKTKFFPNVLNNLFEYKMAMMRHLLQLPNLEQGHRGHHFCSDGSFPTFAEKSKGKTGADEKNDK